MTPLMKTSCLKILVMAVGFLVCITSGYAQEPQVKRTRDLIYAKHDGVALTMDVIQPEKSNGLGIIYIVSGGWRSSHNGIGSGRPFTDRGYTVFYVVHGSQPRFIVEEIVDDIHSAVRYIRCNARQYNINPAKLGITGSSAGGHLSLMIATTGGPKNSAINDSTGCSNSSVQAVACFYPPTDYLNWSAEGDVAVGVGKLSAYSAAFGKGSLTAEGRDTLGRKLSPIYHVNANQPPILIIHGDADGQVPIFQAYRFQNKCKQAGVVCKVNVVKGGGHGGWPDMKKQQEVLVDFFDEYLKSK
jgi:acetyl esterase/lipase